MGTIFNYNGMTMDPEAMGNYTYGYIGAAQGLSLKELYFGSWVVGGFPIGDDFWSNEYKDWGPITWGFYDYHGM